MPLAEGKGIPEKVGFGEVQNSKDDVTPGRIITNGGALALRSVTAKPGGDIADVDALPGNSVSFAYSDAANGSGFTGSVLDYSGFSGRYNVQLSAGYVNSGRNFGFRTRNGDDNTWNPWYELYHTGNKPLKHWSSPGSTLIANTPLIINHGLNIDPDLCILTTKLRCVTANNGYSVGDYAIGFSQRVDAQNAISQGAFGNAGALLTDATVQYNTGQLGVLLMPKNNGTPLAINSSAAFAQWAFEFHIIYQ